MSKYEKLWKYILESNKSELVLSFEEIKEIVGVPLDHSFLKYKKELLEYGYEVSKISMKAQTVLFIKNRKEKSLKQTSRRQPRNKGHSE